MEDLGAVMDAAGSESATLFGFSEGGCMGALFAASYPERCDALVLCGSFARPVRDGDEHSWMPAREVAESFFSKEMEREWGTEARLLRLWAPSRRDDPRLQEWWMRAGRLGSSPAAGVAWMRRMLDIDIRHVLPAVRVPTLVIHAADDRICPVENSRYMAEQIPGARLVELPGDDHLWWLGDPDADPRRGREFLSPARRQRAEPDRVLATVLFTDIVGSTERAAELGDRGWRDLLEQPRRAVRAQLGALPRPRGRRPRATASWPPSTARRAPSAARRAIARRRARARASRSAPGCTPASARCMAATSAASPCTSARGSGALAGPGEVLVSSTVKDLVAGSRHRVRRSRRPRAQGRAGRVAPVRRPQAGTPRNERAGVGRGGKWGRRRAAEGELKPQVYKDPRPAEHFDRFHARTRAKRPNWMYEACASCSRPTCCCSSAPARSTPTRCPRTAPRSSRRTTSRSSTTSSWPSTCAARCSSWPSRSCSRARCSSSTTTAACSRSAAATATRRPSRPPTPCSRAAASWSCTARAGARARASSARPSPASAGWRWSPARRWCPWRSWAPSACATGSGSSSQGLRAVRRPDPLRAGRGPHRASSRRPASEQIFARIKGLWQGLRENGRSATVKAARAARRAAEAPAGARRGR